MYIEIISKNSRTHIDDAWKLKEEIKDKSGLLRQNKKCFYDVYEQSKVYAAKDYNDTLIGYACFIDNNYLSFLAVDVSYQRTGVGRSLIKQLKKDCDYFYLHVRISNDNAYKFYINEECSVIQITKSYYENGEDAYILEYINK